MDDILDNNRMRSFGAFFRFSCAVLSCSIKKHSFSAGLPDRISPRAQLKKHRKNDIIPVLLVYLPGAVNVAGRRTLQARAGIADIIVIFFVLAAEDETLYNNGERFGS